MISKKPVPEGLHSQTRPQLLLAQGWIEQLLIRHPSGSVSTKENREIARS